MRAVVIDDEPSVRRFLQLILTRRGYHVTTYENPTEAQLYRHVTCPCSPQPECPDLIISDLDMPRVNGIDLVERLQDKGCRCRHITIISGSGRPSLEMLEMARSGVRYFPKPVELATINAWLDQVERDVRSRGDRCLSDG